LDLRACAAASDVSLLRSRCHHTASRRRQRRTMGISIERTRSPSGIIQKPSSGRKPSSPPAISRMPSPMRIGLDRGKCQWRSKMRTLWAIRVPNGIEVEPDIGISARSRNRPWLDEHTARSCGAHAACSSGKASALLLSKVWRRFSLERALLPGSSVGRASGC
jgi:hypothetical protein